MIRLTVINEQGEAAVVASAPHFRITGGTIWIGPGRTGETPLVRFVGGHWQYASTFWSGLRFDGKCRLVFGLPREPSSVSDVLEGLSISDGVLTASGIPFALYDEERDMWKGVTANSWWHAFRVESAGKRQSSATSDETPASPAGPPQSSGSSKTRPTLH